MLTGLVKLLASSGASLQCPAQSSTTTGSVTCSTGLPPVSAGTSQIHEVLQIIFGVAAVIAVLMIVIAGMMFATSGGNPESAAKARETIIYAAVGLAVAVGAEAIVTFVLNKI